MSSVAGRASRNPASQPAGIAIAGASTIVSMHPQTLRKYERAGLVRPARLRGGSRTYSEHDLQRLALLRHLSDVLRINVAGMVLLLAVRDEMQQLLAAMAALDADTAADLARQRIGLVIERMGNGHSP